MTSTFVATTLILEHPRSLAAVCFRRPKHALLAGRERCDCADLSERSSARRHRLDITPGPAPLFTHRAGGPVRSQYQRKSPPHRADGRGPGTKEEPLMQQQHYTRDGRMFTRQMIAAR
jgi:hypothetical protein